MTSSSPTGRTLRELVLDLKGDRSYEVLARDCGGRPTSKRLQQIATSPAQKNFLDPDTIRGLARGLGVSVTQVVLASARSCGLDVRDGTDAGALVIGDADRLSSEHRALLLTMARELARPLPISGGFGVVATLTTGSQPAQNDGADDELLDDLAARQGRIPDPEQGGGDDPA